jgi:DUF3071 family protein
MRSVVIKLKLVGASTDLEHLVFSTKKGGRRGSHVTEIDDRLFRVLEDVVRKRRAKEKGEPPPPKKPSAEPKLAPREVQRLLRAGRPVDQVARMAGMDTAWVQRFIGPVLDERTIALQDVWQARLEKQRLGMSGAPLGESVARNLRARRVKITEDELGDAWDASRVDSQPWVISVTFPYRGREQKATWRYNPHTRELTSVNRLANDIGWVPEGRRASAARPSSAKRTTARAANTAKRAPSKKRSPAKKRAAAKRPAAKRRTVKKRPAAKRRTVKKRPAAKRRTTTRRPASKRRPSSKRRTAPKSRASRPKRRTTAKRRPATKRRARR